MSSEQTEITERYIQEIQWSDRATEHEKALVAGNIRQFAHGVMRPLLMVRETEKKMLRADLAALREQLAAKDATIAQQAAEIERLREEWGDIHSALTMLRCDASDGNNWKTLIANAGEELHAARARIAELEAVVGKLQPDS